MSNVIQLKKLEKAIEAEIKEVEETPEAWFKRVQEANRRRQEEMKLERAKANQSVTKAYRLKK